MFKKDLGLLLLIIVVGAAVALINPRFLLPINLSNTANQVGLFGLFSHRRRPSSSSPAASSCRSARSSRCSACIFIDLIVNLDVPWDWRPSIIIVLGGC